MSGCPFESRLSAYYDGELGAEEAAAVGTHVRGCAACAAALRGMRSVSRALAGAAEPALSAEVRARLLAIPDREQDRVLARLGVGLVAAAAALLVAGSVWLWGFLPRNTGAGAWEVVAVASGDEAAEEPEVQMVTWVVRDLSSRRRSR